MEIDFTNKVKKIINDYAPSEAKRMGHEYLGSEHILLGILKSDASIAVKMLLSLNVNLDDLRKEIEKRCDVDSTTLTIDPSEKDNIQKLLERSREEARRMRHNYVGSEHILLAILREPSSLASSALAFYSINYQVIKNELNQALGFGGNSSIQNVQVKKETNRIPVLDDFSRNLNQMALEKKLDPIIGREKEIERIIQILSRKTKNNPILIGEAGVGKTAIVEGLAQRIVRYDVPEILYDSKIYMLDIASIIAGTKYRGEFEERIKRIIKAVQTNPNIILFIDEVHTIIGAGAAEGAVDAANILKPALARGEIHTIGATTIKEYRKYIEKDSALERRFQEVYVEEPKIKDAIQIISGLKSTFEKYHEVTFTEEAIETSVLLSHRYIHDRYLPDKAIDIIDEAGARAKLIKSKLPEKFKTDEKNIRILNKEKNEMVRKQNFERAANLRDKINEAENKLKKDISLWRKKQKSKSIVIKKNDIKNLLSEWTGLKVEMLSTHESEKLLQMESVLEKRIAGQRKAIEKISKALRRSRAGFKNPKKPIGSFIFLGPTGVGKTKLAKSIAEFLFGNEESLIRFDMSEFMELHTVSKFIGSPPGYVGYDDGGLLTEAVRRKPFSVILFDEIEKAHHDIQNILLQILDEGELKDSQGNKIDFRETIIIMTSNAGTRDISSGINLGFNTSRNQNNETKILTELKKIFNPEFLNRINETIIFNPLDMQSMMNISEMVIRDINKNILPNHLFIQVSERARRYLIDKTDYQINGARPLQRIIENEIEDKLAMMVIERKIIPPSEIKISIRNNNLQFKFYQLEPEKMDELKKEYLDYNHNEEASEIQDIGNETLQFTP